MEIFSWRVRVSEVSGETDQTLSYRWPVRGLGVEKFCINWSSIFCHIGNDHNSWDYQFSGWITVINRQYNISQNRFQLKKYVRWLGSKTILGITWHRVRDLKLALKTLKVPNIKTLGLKMLQHTITYLCKTTLWWFNY